MSTSCLLHLIVFKFIGAKTKKSISECMQSIKTCLLRHVYIMLIVSLTSPKTYLLMLQMKHLLLIS